MKLAINYSIPTAQLLSAGKIEFDTFKCPDWPEMISEAQVYLPVAVHFTLKAGSGKLARPEMVKTWDLVERLQEATHTPYVNLHLTPTIKNYPGIPADTPEPEQYEQVVERLFADVSAAVKRFGGEQVILENVPYGGRDGKFMRPAVEPVVIRRLMEEMGCGLLLDIAHARLAAFGLGMSEFEYMAQLPGERLRELHFTGLGRVDGHYLDHFPISESDWPALDWVLERIRTGQWARPWLLAFEYGGVGEKFDWRTDPAVISEQVPQLYRKVKDV